MTDLLRFADAHLRDTSLATLRAVHSEVPIHGWLDAWCLGWARFDWEGASVWGWDGVISGQRAVLRIVPELGGAIGLLTNADTGRDLYRSLFPELMDACFGIGVPALRLEPSRAAARDLARFAGVYAWPDWRWEVSASDTYLLMQSSGRTVEALPIDDRAFLVAADNADWPTVTFGAFDGDGRPGVLYQMLWGLPRV